MFTNNKANQVDSGHVYIESVCLSTDAKPTAGIANGSLVLEMDTGKIYAFNEAGAAWVELQ